jgi:prepilin-type N-terminal cleavage/methylation domain-containing protein
MKNQLNKKAFTMIELIFVIVIISIIAAISIPKLTATKDDALSVSIKNDISNTATSVITAYNSTDNLNDISKAIFLDNSRWKKGANTNSTPNLAYTFVTKENKKECVKMQINDSNSTRVFQVLIASNTQDITGNDSKVCAKLRKIYSKTNGKYDNMLGDSVNDSIIQYLNIMNIQLDSDGLSW